MALERDVLLMIYDCFMFNDELDLLEVRLNHHAFVDRFILIESTKTYMGKPKPLYYDINKQRFSSFSSKIHHIVLDYQFDGNDDWKFEHLQRNILKGFNFNDDDVILYADCDEIVRDKSIVDTFINFDASIMSLQMDLCFYYFNLRLKDKLVRHENYHLNSCFNNKWHMAKLLRGSMFKRFNNLYEIRQWEIDNPQMILDAGWHFSNLGNAERVYNKLKAISHAEDNEFKNLTLSTVAQNRLLLLDPLGRAGVQYEILKELPPYIVDNKERFSEYFC